MIRHSLGLFVLLSHPVVAVCLMVLAWPAFGFSSQVNANSAERVRTEIPYREGKIVLISDFQQRIDKTRFHASGRVEITYQDIVLTCDEAEYDEVTQEALTRGKTRFSQNQQWLVCSRAEFNFKSQTGVFYDASGYTDREFFLNGRTIIKTGPDTYRVEKGIITACQQENPKWSFSASKTNLRIDHTARLHHLVFKVKNIPLLYAPYLLLPMEKKKRSSGFLPFHIGNSSSKGRVFSQSYFQTLGRSADTTIYGDYFSLRGMALGGIIRARPNPQTRLYIQAYGIDDKLNQGGVLLFVDGETLLKNDWRAVARVNIVSNFLFRQAFSESFRSATISEERASAFLTKNRHSFSINIAYQRDEAFFPIHPIVIRKLPSLELLSLGKSIGRSPIIFYLRTSLDGLSRIDSSLETSPLIQRVDLYPRFALRLPPFKGFSLLPSAGFRETYYGARRSENSSTGVINQALNRRYADFQVDLKTPTLEKKFSTSWLGNFKHVVEPVITYRKIQGIKDLDETIRFDEEDAIANTNEIEYGIVNRFFKSRENSTGIREDYEYMSFSLFQKYYFDPTFGGAFQAGDLNIFYPLNTLTGFSHTGISRGLAPISMIARLSPNSGIHHDIRADFDTKLQRFRNASLSTIWQQNGFFLAGTYFRIQSLETRILSSNHIQGQVGYGSPLNGLSASLTLSYNLQTSQLLNSHSRLNYMWDCCGVAVEFSRFQLGLRTESRFNFSFTLKGIGSFGNLKRSESLF